MRQSSVFILLLISLLTACTASKAVPLPTAASSATALPSPTATPPPTATITPEPTTPPGFRVENDGTLIGPDGVPVLDANGNPIEAEQVVTDENGRMTVLDAGQPTLVIDRETDETYAVTDGRVTVGDATLEWQNGAWVAVEPTLVPTVEPTDEPTPEPTFEPMVFYSGEKVEKFTHIPYEFITSGRLTRDMQTRVTEWPDEVFLANMYIQTGFSPYGTASAGFDVNAKYRFYRRTRPERLLTFWITNIQGKDLIGGSWQVRNADGTTGIMNGLVRSLERNRRFGGDDLIGRLYRGERQISVVAQFAKDCVVWEGFLDICAQYQLDGKQLGLVKQWVETGIIPAGFGEVLFQTITTPW